MKSFHEQFEVCATEGMHGRGPVLPYALHAGLIPHDPVAGKFRIDREVELPTVGCLRFGGICCGGNPGCVGLRARVGKVNGEAA